jgi:hypothetical protein
VTKVVGVFVRFCAAESGRDTMIIGLCSRLLSTRSFIGQALSEEIRCARFVDLDAMLSKACR